MQLLLLPILTSHQPPLLFGDPRLLQFAPGPQIDPIAPAIQHSPPPSEGGDEGGDEGCKLLDSFAIVVQVSLATTALLTLVYKRWRERPQRPVPIWALDVSKQFIGAGIIHFLNLLVSYVVGRPVHGPPTNLCVWYFLNVFMDTTIGVAILWFWLHALQWILQKLFHLRYIRTGHYGPPPIRRKLGPWAQQTAVFVISEGLMKLCVFEIFRVCPFLFDFGKWVLAWTRGNYRYQVVFVMFIFPLIMNAIQFWIVDTIVKVTPSLVDPRKPSPANYAYPDQEHRPSHDRLVVSSGDTIVSVPNANERTPLLDSTSHRHAASV